MVIHGEVNTEQKINGTVSAKKSIEGSVYTGIRYLGENSYNRSEIDEMLSLKQDVLSSDQISKLNQDHSKFLTQHQSLVEYAKKSELPKIPSDISAFNNDVGYLTNHQSLNGYATEAWVEGKNYLTQHQSLAAYATLTWVNSQGFIKSLSGYATEAWTKNQGYLTEHQNLNGYATESWVNGQGFLKTHQSLADYYTKGEVDNLISNSGGGGDGITLSPSQLANLNSDHSKYLTEANLNGYATESWVTNKNYLTEHQSLAGYATENFVTSQGYLTEHQDISGKANLSGADFTGAISIGANNLNMQSSRITGTTGNGLQLVHNNKPIVLYDNMLYSLNPTTAQLGTAARPWGTINATNINATTIKEGGTDISTKYALKTEIPSDSHINDLINQAFESLQLQKYYTGSSSPASSLGANGDLYLKV